MKITWPIKSEKGRSSSKVYWGRRRRKKIRKMKTSKRG